MDKIKILWVDDEVEHLKPHILFLQEKGYDVATANNGQDALDLIAKENFDIVFLDENMPGLSGIETLNKLKNIRPNLPVVMITKSEEENIMEEAIGGKISDYLIKPVNPKQILLSLKKTLEDKKLISEKTALAYQQEFRNIGMTIGDHLSFAEWTDVYKKLTYWELELNQSSDDGMSEVLKMQKAEANLMFSKFYESHYRDWLMGKDSPLLSHTLLKNKLVPLLNQDKPVFLLLIDNLRYDQWKVLQPVIENYFRVVEDDIYFGIIPTATQYARNALFAGLMPSEIEKKYPQYWLNDEDEGLKNTYEGELLSENLKRLGKDVKHSFNKILNYTAGKKFAESASNLLNNKLNVIVYNFVDMLSHARTDMEMIKELADDEAAYRSLTLSWFEHSPLYDFLKMIAEKKVNLLITTDHGSIRVNTPVKVLGDKNTNTNLRYKQGKSLNYEKKEVFEIRNPLDYFLPKQHVSTSFIFARENKFFAYPNNFNYYVNYYKNTFQHGGISLEEVLIPVITLTTK